MITDFVHPDSIVPMLTRITALRTRATVPTAAEAVMLRLDGSPVDAEIVSVLTSWDGKPAYQVIFRDLTMEKAARVHAAFAGRPGRRTRVTRSSRPRRPVS